MKYVLTAIIILSVFFAEAQQTFSIADSFKIAGVGGWDYLAVQPNSNRLFVSHGTQVNVVNKTNGDSLGVISNTIGVHGIAFVPSLNKGYTSNGRLNNVFVFDLKTLAITDSIKTGKNPDAIFYDEYSKTIITCNGGSNDLSFIDPVSGKVTATVPVGGKPETAVSDGAGAMFVNIEDKNEIVKVNTHTMKVEAHWSLLPGEAPTGLAFDKDTKRLFAACGDNNQLVIVNAASGAIVSRYPIGGHCDGLAFDVRLKNIYTSNGEGSLTVFHQDSPDKYTLVSTVSTQKGARTITADQETHLVYLPTAALEPQVGQSRPKMIPGTFKVIVVSPK